jgi:hypothetical protein
MDMPTKMPCVALALQEKEHTKLVYNDAAILILAFADNILISIKSMEDLQVREIPSG